MLLSGRCLVPGEASGKLLFSDAELSFWGGVDFETGKVVDHHHPLLGQDIADRILAIPSGKGSCTGSQAVLELLAAKHAPAALVFARADPILALGVLVAESFFGLSIPVLVLSPDDFGKLREVQVAAVKDGVTLVGETRFAEPMPNIVSASADLDVSTTTEDRQILAGEKGEAAKIALEIILRFAKMQDAECLLDVSRAHIDATIYTGPAGLQFAKKILTMGARFAVPTTLNAISVDQQRWREIGMEPEQSKAPLELANTYMSMGAESSFSCAPYSFDSAPQAGDQIGWSESNAVIFANSVLGARTQKYPDFLDVCIALTGRAPATGCHLSEGRIPTVRIQVESLQSVDDSTYPMLGYVAGQLTQGRIPLICGMEDTHPRISDLKSFSAAFGTASSAPMFHMVGITPEANQFTESQDQLPCLQLKAADLTRCWNTLNTAEDPSVQLTSLGSPHFLLEEFEELADLCHGRKKNPQVDVTVTTNRAVYQKAAAAGLTDSLEEFGAVILTDTCWCMISEPVIQKKVRNLMTNSAKYAHYAPGIVKRGVHFGSLSQCVEAACRGSVDDTLERPLENGYKKD